MTGPVWDPTRFGRIGDLWGVPIVETDRLPVDQALVVGAGGGAVRIVLGLTEHQRWIAELRSIVRNGVLAAFPDLRLPPARPLPSCFAAG